MKTKNYELRISVLGRTAMDAVRNGHEFSGEQSIIEGSPGVHVCSRLPGDMAFRLGEVIRSFLDAETNAKRLPVDL